MRAQIGTSLGLAVTSTVSTAVSTRFLAGHPLLHPSSPSVLLQGYRAAGWVCFAAAALAILATVLGLRDMPIVLDVDVSADAGSRGEEGEAYEMNSKGGAGSSGAVERRDRDLEC